MFTFPPSVEVYMAVEAMDMRKGFDSLAAAAKEVMCQDPLSGHLFVFFNRGRSRVKVLFFDRSGYCLYYKRLEQGTFHFPPCYGIIESARFPNNRAGAKTYYSSFLGRICLILCAASFGSSFPWPG